MKVIFVDKPIEPNENGVGVKWVTKTQRFGGTFREFIDKLEEDGYLERNDTDGIYVYDLSHTVTSPVDNNVDSMRSILFIRFAPIPKEK